MPSHLSEPVSDDVELLSSGSSDNVTAQVIMFGWRASEGEEAKKKRAAAKLAEQELARKPKEAVKVVEDDLDMFSWRPTGRAESRSARRRSNRRPPWW